jgi:neopullulanase
MKKIFSILFLLAAITSDAADTVRIYPSHWWVGMKNNKLQLMLYGKDLSSSVSNITVNYAGVKVDKVNRVENRNYLFVDLTISATAKPGRFMLQTGGSSQFPAMQYELRARSTNNGKSRVQGVTSEDFIYLAMPDRFSNGDTTNDRFGFYRDKLSDRKDPLLRHGGDLKGLTNHLDYLKDLGVTAIWLCPVIENDMPLEKESAGSLSGYHGYWFTDHYQVDKRYGGNAAYLDFVNAAHAKGLKVVQDAVYNHVGERHWFVDDLPSKDWINQWSAYQNTNHREEVFIDRYASPVDKKIMIEGWFTPHLPDLNLRNAFLANYLVQNSIWITEHFGIDGWRVDTYKYCDEAFLNRINKALETEFPRITAFGEAWVNTVAASAYFCENNVAFPFKHNMQGTTDFPLNSAMLDGIRQNFGWTEGVNRLYMTVSQDALYKDPLRNCIFLDNHDMDRFFSVAGEDLGKYKRGITWLLTMRGIPQLYYGTEILMKNFKNPSDAMVRLDFPGGWPGDPVNKFTAEGRTADENTAFNFVKALATFRKNSSALKTGKLMQYIPNDGVYVYFRYDDNQTVMVITNTNEAEKQVRITSFTERTNRFSKGRDVLTGREYNLFNLKIGGKESMVLELMK